MGDASVSGSGIGSLLGLGGTSTSTSTKVSSKGPRLSSANDWLAWRTWFRGQLFSNDYISEFKSGGAAEVLRKTYGILASSIDGDAVTCSSGQSW